MNNKNMSRVLLVVAAVLILGGIFMLALLVPGASSLFYKVCLAAVSILCILIGLGLLLFLYLGRDADPNFFLYDPKTGRNITPEDLDFDRINSRMSYFMTTLTTSVERLWTDNALGTVPVDRFGINGIYRPLAAYKMLYDLTEFDSPDGWRLFLNATPATITALGDALRENGEDTMVATLIKAYNSASSGDDFEWLRDFLMGNKPYLSRRMTGYVRKNLDWFY
jgi:hypothetical protein